MAMDMTYFNEMEAKIPHGKVRTRFAPSPTGFLHTGSLFTSMVSYTVAKRSGGVYFFRLAEQTAIGNSDRTSKQGQSLIHS